MSNLWYPKQQPLAGMNGFGGGATSLAFKGASGPGGDPTANKSVEFNDDDSEYLSVGASTDLTLGTGSFTVECFVMFDDNENQGVWQLEGISSNYVETIAVAHNGSSWHGYQGGSTWNYGGGRNTDQWYHVVYQRSGGTNTIYVDGSAIGSFTNAYNYAGTTLAIGGYYSTGHTLDGKVSNFRLTKGQAIYSSNFTPATSMLTTTSQGATASNVKVLCCQNTTVLGATVTPVEITANGTPTLSNEHPF
tara:strand:- start:63 stop:806 length:744 start_codon:yes stop_codon:yes gene_type:complete